MASRRGKGLHLLPVFPFSLWSYSPGDTCRYMCALRDARWPVLGGVLYELHASSDSRRGGGGALFCFLLHVSVFMDVVSPTLNGDLLYSVQPHAPLFCLLAPRSPILV
jgi:hypothetical protein